MQVPSFDTYLVTFIDDTARFIRGFLIPNKKANTVLEAFKIFKNLAETKLAKRIQAIRTDNGTEYQGVLKDYLKDQGIEHQVTTPYSPESNGVAEWYNRTIMEMVRPMLHHPGYRLPLGRSCPCRMLPLESVTIQGTGWQNTFRSLVWM